MLTVDIKKNGVDFELKNIHDEKPNSVQPPDRASSRRCRGKETAAKRRESGYVYVRGDDPSGVGRGVPPHVG